MEVINSFMTWILKNRISQIDRFKAHPIEVQQEILFKLINTAKNTKFGKKYNFSQTGSYS
jgi:hypothetical protein